MDFTNFGKQTKNGDWRFSQSEKSQAWEHLCNQRATVTARHADRDRLERLAELTALIDELTAERKQLIDLCEQSIMAVGKPLDDTGNKWVAFVQRKGKGFPFVLSITRTHKRADFSGWCRAHGVTAEQVISDGFATDVAESRSIAPAGKSHIDKLIRDYCLYLANNK